MAGAISQGGLRLLRNGHWVPWPRPLICLKSLSRSAKSAERMSNSGRFGCRRMPLAWSWHWAYLTAASVLRPDQMFGIAAACPSLNFLIQGSPNGVATFKPRNSPWITFFSGVTGLPKHSAPPFHAQDSGQTFLCPQDDAVPDRL
jgi:hypothetical protein